MNYPSNPSRHQFELIRPDLEAARQSTRPRKYDLYALFCAVAYVLKTGCQWRQLPADFPNWQSVYYYYRVWSEEQIIDEPSILDKCLKKLSLPYGKKQSRSAKTSFIIIDAQSVKNTDTAEHHGYDGGKRISGIKRHLAVDINGLPQAIHITTANVSDRDGASAMLALNYDHLRQVKSVLVDGGYTGSNFAADVYTNLKATVQVAKRNELHKFEVLPQRWIIERSFSWLDKCRRLWKNCERQLNTSRQMVILAFLVLLLKRF
ncbi:IS5 family transposase [Lactiplantibacillus plantarum]|uniref:IS5 family transposase n=1 Tax=Lactiplantibacillus plantarum TaxID=1590 RepID=UPI0021CB0FB0|nr:IS5 family transposase [Lactiplantibacillus plantarum]